MGQLSDPQRAAAGKMVSRDGAPSKPTGQQVSHLKLNCGMDKREQQDNSATRNIPELARSWPTPMKAD